MNKSRMRNEALYKFCTILAQAVLQCLSTISFHRVYQSCILHYSKSTFYIAHPVLDEHLKYYVGIQIGEAAVVSGKTVEASTSGKLLQNVVCDFIVMGFFK